jgi:hypothetical protein
MAVQIDRLVVRAAIEKLLTEKDAQWLESAQIVLNEALFLDSSDQANMEVVLTRGAPPAIPSSAVFGDYALLDYSVGSCIAIVTISDLTSDTEKSEYRIFYGDEYEPVVVIRLTFKPQRPETMSWAQRLRAWTAARMQEELSRIFPWRVRKRESQWEITEAVVVYSDTSEWKPGDQAPVE